MSSGTTIEMNAAAGQELGALSPRRHEVHELDRERAGALVLAEEDQRHEVVVPHPEELEDGERGDRRLGQREHDPPEDPEVGGAVDAGGFEHVLRQRGDVVVQQEDGERQAEGGVGEPDGDRLVVEVEVRDDHVARPGEGQVGAARVELLEGHERHLHGHGHHRQHGDEQPVAPLEVHPREGVRRRRGDGDGDERARDGDGEAVEHGLPERQRPARRVEQRPVVVGERERGIGDRRPPPGRELRGPRTERADEQAERRDRPDDDQYPQRRRRDGASSAVAMAPGRRRVRSSPPARGGCAGC